jgi:hypothetical protein
LSAFPQRQSEGVLMRPIAGQGLGERIFHRTCAAQSAVCQLDAAEHLVQPIGLPHGKPARSPTRGQVGFDNDENVITGASSFKAAMAAPDRERQIRIDLVGEQRKIVPVARSINARRLD